MNALAYYVEHSQPLATPLFTNQGYVQLQGVHALAGIELEYGHPIDDLISSPDIHAHWARRMQRFWHTLALANWGEDLWLTSWELRLTGCTKCDSEIQASLWAKAFSSNPKEASHTARNMAETARDLCPPECQPQPVTSKDTFDRLWGSGDLTYQAEVRRMLVPMTLQINSPNNPRVADWRLNADGWREVWDLVRRQNGRVWLSIGICPTKQFPTELPVNKNTKNAPSETETPPQNGGNDRFMVRIRAAGEAQAVSILCLMAAGVLSGDNYSDHAVIQVESPYTHADWDAARFNWQWADFLPWGENNLPAGLERLPFLCKTSELGILGGFWGIRSDGVLNSNNRKHEIEPEMRKP
jgi:hypothetical protein